MVGFWNVQYTGNEEKSKKACMVATITAQENQLTLDEAGFIDGELDHCVVTLTQLKSTSEYVGESKEFPPSSVWIIGTDYSSYSVFFLCKNGHKQDGIMFFCTRDKNPTFEVLENARNAIIKAGLMIGDDYLFPVDNSNC
nr:uncharacterized protein LOC111426116 [Onthophagus taurus]